MTHTLKWAKPLYQPLGQDIFCTGKKFLVFNLVSRNLKIKYKQSILGVFWTLMTPLAMTAVYYFVFKVILNIQIPHHLAFILTGILAWNFMSQTILEGMESIVGNLALLSKVPIPLPIFPFVGCLTNFVTYLLAMPIMIGAILVSGAPIGFSFLLLPVYWVLLFFITYAIALSLALIFVKLRDLRHIMGILLQIWFYGTPVIFSESMIPQKYQWILYLNPFGCLISDLHLICIQGTWPPVHHFLTVGGWAFSLILLSSLFYKSLSKGLVEQI